MAPAPRFLDLLDVPPAPDGGRLDTDAGELTWSRAAVTLAGDPKVEFADPLAPGSIQLSRWTGEETTAVSGWFGRLFGATENVERHWLLLELRTARQRLRIRAAVDDPARLDGLAPLDTRTENKATEAQIDDLLAACVIAGMTPVRMDVASDYGSSWVDDTHEGRSQRERTSSAPSAKPEVVDFRDLFDGAGGDEPTPVSDLAPVLPEDDEEAHAPDADEPGDDGAFDDVEPAQAPPDLEPEPAETGWNPAPGSLSDVRLGFGPDAQTPDLGAALRALDDDGTLTVEAGRFSAPAPVRLPRRVIGAGSDESTLVGRLEMPGAAFAADGFDEITGVTLTREGSAPGLILSVAHGDVTVDHCRITGGKGTPDAPGHGISARGGHTSVRVRQSYVNDNEGDGLALADGARADVEFTALSGNRRHGIATTADGEPGQLEVRSSRMERNGACGLLVESANAMVVMPRVTVADTTLAANGAHGAAFIGAAGVVRDAQLSTNQMAGLFASQRARVDAERCRMQHNSVGIQTSADAAVDETDCLVQANRRAARWTPPEGG